MFLGTETLFTIGQFAKLHEINKKTLMWYDETGLLKPAVIRENGYRYYSYRQSARLETILLLRELNMSIPEIRRFLNNRSAASLEQLLRGKLVELDETIAHLRAVRAVVDEKQQDMAALGTLDLSAISLVEKPEAHYLVTVPAAPDMPFEEAAERVMAAVKKHQLRRLRDASYGSLLPVESLYRGELDAYSAFYIELPFPARRKGLHVQPRGTYLRAFCRGSWDGLPRRYEEILSYAAAHGLRLSGFSYEKGINELVADAPEDYITQIEIPVRADQSRRQPA